jgi:hypothetical protein
MIGWLCNFRPVVALEGTPPIFESPLTRPHLSEVPPSPWGGPLREQFFP